MSEDTNQPNHPFKPDIMFKRIPSHVNKCDICGKPETEHEPSEWSDNQPSNDQTLDEQYESSGLAQIAFNSNGRDFSPETVKELLQWRDTAVKRALIDELKGLRRYKGQDADEEVNLILEDRIKDLSHD